MSDLKPCPFIELTKGKRALVSITDFGELSKWKWHAANRGGKWYAARSMSITGTKRAAIVYMHRHLLPEATEVDHINGDGLDNRRENLRAVTHAENLRNQAPQVGRSSRFKGVYWSTNDECWRVQIKDGGQRRTIGGIASEETAAAIYDLLAADRFGEHARLNHRPIEDALRAEIANLKYSIKASDQIEDELLKEIAALKADRDEELRGRLAAEHRFDEAMNAKSALENVVCLEDKWVAVEGGGYHRAVSSDKLGDLYDRLRRAEGRTG